MGGTFPPTFWTGPSHLRQFTNTLQIPRESNAVCEAKDLGRFLQTGAKISAFSFKHEVSSFGARVTGSEAACCRCEPQPTAAEGQGSSGLQQAPAWPQHSLASPDTSRRQQRLTVLPWLPRRASFSIPLVGYPWVFCSQKAGGLGRLMNPQKL